VLSLARSTIFSSTTCSSSSCNVHRLRELYRLLAPQHVLGMAMLWARVMVACAHSICGIRVEVTGLERIPEGAALIASRHQSAFDTFVWMTLLPRCCYVVKQELLRIPLFGKHHRLAHDRD
jgi:1-acyl-sn-glycerol-3-phosphate acyltransferase